MASVTSLAPFLNPRCKALTSRKGPGRTAIVVSTVCDGNSVKQYDRTFAATLAFSSTLTDRHNGTPKLAVAILETKTRKQALSQDTSPVPQTVGTVLTTRGRRTDVARSSQHLSGITEWTKQSGRRNHNERRCCSPAITQT